MNRGRGICPFYENFLTTSCFSFLFLYFLIISLSLRVKHLHIERKRGAFLSLSFFFEWKMIRGEGKKIRGRKYGECESESHSWKKFVRREYLFRINQIFVNMGKDFHDRGSCANHVEKETGSTKGIFWKREFVRCR